MADILESQEMQLVREAARLLYDRGARRVWLFGSLAMGRPLDEYSDVDFAVEGLPPQQFSRTYRDLNQMVGTKVDLVYLEAAPPPLRPHILRTRVLVPRED